jgi:uridylate kinase
VKQPIVISLGGSVIVPGPVNVRFLRAFRELVRTLQRRYQVAIICGGGAPARRMIVAARSLGVKRAVDLHWIGIRQTQVNAELVRSVLRLTTPVLTSYSPQSIFREKVVIAAGRRPGASTDLGAVILAQALRAKKVFNITNVDGVYSADPRKVRSARMLPRLSWASYRRMFGRTHRSGAHSPFDPIASRQAAQRHLEVVVLSSNLSNLRKAIAGQLFRGSTLGPT